LRNVRGKTTAADVETAVFADFPLKQSIDIN
jgi:hypothetical protein